MINKVLISCPCHEVLITLLEQHGLHCDYRPHISRTETLECLAQYSVLVVSTSIIVDAELLAAGPALHQLGRLGSGLETIDTQALEQRGIALCSSPEGNARAVAEFVLGRILEDSRNIARSMNETRQGIWCRNENRGDELEHKRIGIIGYGSNGSLTAKLCQAMGMEVLVYDKHKSLDLPDMQVMDSPQSLVESLDYLSFHVPYTPETRHYLDDDLLACAKKPFRVINISRGEIISTSALLRALDSGKIITALLDVIEEERQEIQEKEWRPSAEMYQKLQRHPAVKITPHIAGYSYQAVYKMSKILAEKIVNGSCSQEK